MSGQAASASARPSGVVTSQHTDPTSPVATALTSATAWSSVSRVRPFRVTCTPSRASAVAQPLPRPLLDAHTSARRPAIPMSIVVAPVATCSAPV